MTTRSQSRKYRGLKTQALVAERWRKNGLFPFAKDQGPGRPGEDILDTPDLWVEVKAQDSVTLPALVRKARIDALTAEALETYTMWGGDPLATATERYKDNDFRYPYSNLAVIIWRHNGQGEKSMDEWTVTMSLADFEALWRKAQCSE